MASVEHCKCDNPRVKVVADCKIVKKINMDKGLGKDRDSVPKETVKTYTVKKIVQNTERSSQTEKVGREVSGKKKGSSQISTQDKNGSVLRSSLGGADKAKNSDKLNGKVGNGKLPDRRVSLEKNKVVSGARKKT